MSDGAPTSNGVSAPEAGRPGRLEASLVARRDAGHKLLIPYVTGGMDDHWLLTVEALAGAGADAIEVGIPFSDPMIDGPTIQEASLRALDRGTTPDGILADLESDRRRHAPGGDDLLQPDLPGRARPHRRD